MRQSGLLRRQALLQAALDLFSTHGFDATTTRAIASRVGVTEALLFKHFASKLELLRAVVAELGPRAIFTPLPESTQQLPVRDALGQLLGDYLDNYWANRACLRMMWMAGERDRAIFDEVRAQFGAQTLALYTLIAQRTGAGELRPGCEIAATDTIGSATGGFLLGALGDEPAHWETARHEFIQHLLDVALNGLLVGPPPVDSVAPADSVAPVNPAEREI